MARRLTVYLLRRLGFAALLVSLVSSAALVLAGLAPGDYSDQIALRGGSPEAVARERTRLGLDRPLLEQYVVWVGRAVRFDLGESFRFQRPVAALVRERIGKTALLGFAALAFATLLGLPLGVLTGTRSGWVPGVIRAASLVLLSVPPLISSLLLALLASRTGWFPVGGFSPAPVDAGWLEGMASVARQLALPALALGLPFAATIERLQSQAMLAAVAQPHIVAARARGLSWRRVVWRHALRDALRPVAAIYGIVIGTLLGGSFVVEYVTSWPGLGKLMFDALVSRDVYLVAGCAAAGSVVLAAGMLVSDLLLATLDPRLREEAR